MKGDESRNQKSMSLVVLEWDNSHRTFGASVASDAGAFADEVLVAGFVVRVNDGRDAVEGPLERVPAQALMTLSDDAVDAAVRTVSNAVHHLG